MVSHNLLWRPWVTVRISESLSDISFLNIILNAIFEVFRAVQVFMIRQTLLFLLTYIFNKPKIYTISLLK